jgi:hypothetical protein
MLALTPENGQPDAQHKLPAGSTYGFKMTIILPEYNLDKLAEADCAHYARNAANDFEGDIDERVNLILPPSASKAPSTSSSTSTKPTPPPPDRLPQGRAEGRLTQSPSSPQKERERCAMIVIAFSSNLH